MLRAVSSGRSAAPLHRCPQLLRTATTHLRHGHCSAGSSAMDETQFQFMRKVIAAPSPVGL